MAALAAGAAMLAGCLVLHWRIRNRWSAGFIVSLMALAAWTTWGSDWLWSLEADVAGGSDADILSTVGAVQSRVVVVETVLALSFAITFLMTTLSIRKR